MHEIVPYSTFRLDKAYEVEAKKNTVMLRDTLTKIKGKLSRLSYSEQV